MEYTINQERLMKVMEKYFYELYPDFKLPLEVLKLPTRTSYYSEDGEPWFIEYDDIYQTQSKWSITDKIEPIYNFFGEDAVEMFVEWFFGLNIKDKGTKKYNWLIA
jgi:hypothetical protein